MTYIFSQLRVAILKTLIKFKIFLNAKMSIKYEYFPQLSHFDCFYSLLRGLETKFLSISQLSFAFAGHRKLR